MRVNLRQVRVVPLQPSADFRLQFMAEGDQLQVGKYKLVVVVEDEDDAGLEADDGDGTAGSDGTAGPADSDEVG